MLIENDIVGINGYTLENNFALIFVVIDSLVVNKNKH